MEIQFVNHASYILRSKEINLLCDPWIEGQVFHNGWEHIAKTQFTFEDFQHVNYIWFSHEHPDHFFPPNISKIPLACRENITVLYQYTADKKVIDFIKSKSFKDVIELPPGEWVKLTEDFSLMCDSIFDDSWLCVKAEGKVVLNVNDCQILNTEMAEQLMAKTGQAKVDLLFTQFSYACYCGNEDEPEKRKHAVQEKVREVETQIAVFNPKWVVPFASFVWFCHEENVYMNDEILPIDKAAMLIEANDTKAVVLYCNEKWTLGDQHPNDGSINKWMQEYKTISTRDVVRLQPKLAEDIMKAAYKFVQEVGTKLDFVSRLYAKYRFQPIRFWVKDLAVLLYLDYGNKIVRIEHASNNVDIEISSEALLYCLTFNWGFNTTHVNGRYQLRSPMGALRFEMIMGVADAINHNHPIISIGSIANNVLKRIFSAKKK